MFSKRQLSQFTGLLCAVALLGGSCWSSQARAQATPSPAPPRPSADASQGNEAPAVLSEDQLEVLVARIALYPDELVALVSAASLYPLQIVEAERYLETVKSNPKLKPKDSWDGSVVSLLNYPDIVKMMSSDLDWTQQLASAIAYQQKDVLVAIQQLRDKAVADGVIKSDDKITVTNDSNNNIVIQPTNEAAVYVPRYEPQMLYDPGYQPAPIAYYPEPYPQYYYPTATFFAGAVTGAVFAAAVDWNNWGVWGGRWGGDVDIDCNNCFNNRNFNGKMNINDVDWKNVDRSKINFDRNQFADLNKNNFGNSITSDTRNNIGNKAANVRENRAGTIGGASGIKDVRQSTLQGLKNAPQAEQRRTATQQNRAAGQGGVKNRSGSAGTTAKRPSGSKSATTRPKGSGSARVNRPSSGQRMASRPDNRSRTPSGLGQVRSGKSTQLQSQRGSRSMSGGGGRGGGAARGGGGRGGGGRGGGGGRR